MSMTTLPELRGACRRRPIHSVRRADGRQRVAAAPDQDQAVPVPPLPPVMTTTLPSNRMTPF
jgi:hypothetical protein